MLPTTAFAAAAEAYEKNEVARVITTDTEIAEDIDGLVLVDAPCKVTVKDAKLSVGIVVSPDAAGAEVILTGTTEAAEVVVLSASSVKVEETATATSVTVDAAEATVEVAGTAAEVIVTENAEKTAVTVAETAKVETVSVAAPAAAVEVVGEVKTVAVAETAAAATVTVAETATVSALEVAAPDVKADVAGTVESVTVAETATGAELVVAETATITEVTDATGELTVSGDGADKVTVNDTTASEEEEEDEEDEDEEITNPDVPFIPPVVETKQVKICWSPQGSGDQSDALSGTHTLNGVTMSSENGPKTTTTTATVQDDGSARASVNITATDVEKHETSSGSGGQGYWIGFGVPLPEGGTYEEANNTTVENAPYKYYVIEKKADANWDVSGAANRVYEVDNTFFNTLYFNIPEIPAETDSATSEYIVVVTENATEKTGDVTADDADGAKEVTIDGANESLTLEAEENVVYIFDVTITATETSAATPTTNGNEGGEET